MARFAAVRNPAIVQAYATGCYSMKGIVGVFDIYQATVNRVSKKEFEKYECKT